MERAKTSKPPLAVTMGDPAGIGPCLVAEAFRRQRERNLPDLVFFGDPEIFKAHGIEIPTSKGKSSATLAVHPIPLKERVVPGEPNPKNAKASLKAIEAAAKAALEGKVSGLVTCPVHKKSLLEANFKHSGHTGYLGELGGAEPVMMLACGDFRTVPVTVHLPLKEAATKLTRKRIVQTAKIVARDLEKRFKIPRPRLALSGLNPHAGEEGRLGDEEQKIIAPAIRELQKAGLHAEGPFPADTAFIEPMRMRFDAHLAMTHDQALIPVKTLDFRKAVNITLGLPFVRTSPAHGTAFDLVRAGRTPDPESFFQALIMARQLAP